MAEKKGLIEEWITIHKQLRPNSDVSIPQLPDILFSFGDLGTGPHFQGVDGGQKQRDLRLKPKRR